MASTHAAVVTVGPGQPIEVIQVPTVEPGQGEVKVRIEWAASSPLDVYQVEAGLMVQQYPQGLGDSGAGVVVQVGPGVKNLQAGDRVFGFFFHNEQERAQQVYVTAPEHLFGKIPPEVPSAAAATIPNNFVTAFYSLSVELGLNFPWPRPEGFSPIDNDRPILIWGGSSSVGQYAIQILRYYGYTNIIATASTKHHEKLKEFGARYLFDYSHEDVVSSVSSTLPSQSKPLLVFDCIDSKLGSLAPISMITKQPGSTVAALLPVVVQSISASDPAKSLALAAEVEKEASWAQGVKVLGVKTYLYESDEFLKEKMQPEIMPTMLSNGAIKPNSQRIVDAPTLLERARYGLNLMKSGAVSGQRVIWRVWTPEEFGDM